MRERPDGTSIAHPEPLRLGISSCLLEKNVRYDGGHKRNSFLMEVLGRYIEWVNVCPEVDIGLGTPRPPIRAELGEAIHGYRSGLAPLIVPIVLLRHYVRRLEVDYLADQVYLEPHPHELMLLNHV